MTAKDGRYKLYLLFTASIWCSQFSTAQAADFDTRCNNPDVVRCWDFDSLDDIGTPGFYDAADESKCKNGVCKVIDTTIKASGAGSLRMEVPSHSAANTSGGWRENFSDDYSVQFGENQEFYMQWRQRFSTTMLTNVYQHTRGNGGWKTIIIGEGDRRGYNAGSCTKLEQVINNGYYRTIPQGYWGCGVGGAYQTHSPDIKAYDFKLQNMVDNGAGTEPLRYCTYLNAKNLPDRPVPGCFPFYANEWMTFQMHVKIGNWDQPNSQVDVWAAREGKPSVHIISRTEMTIHQEIPGQSKYGKVWLLPYNTAKDSSQSHPIAYTWYDDVIVSRTKIPDPVDPPKPRHL